MSTNTKVLTKLLQARGIIAKTPIKKEGKNAYSNYDYFTPSQVSQLVEDACQQTGLVPMFSLVREEYPVVGEMHYVGKLTVADSESGELLEFTLVTAMPDIKATNEAQKLGGMMTYTERYLKSSAFGIVDNNLDLDNHDNRPSGNTPQKKTVKEEKPQPKEVKKPAPKAEKVDEVLEKHHQKFLNLLTSKPTMGVIKGAVGKALTEYKISPETLKEWLTEGGVKEDAIAKLIS